MLSYLNNENDEYLNRNKDLQDIDWKLIEEDMESLRDLDYSEWLEDLEDEDFSSSLLDK